MRIKQLNDSVAVLAGVGPKKQAALNQLGIHSVLDLLTDYPFRYEDFTVQDLVNAPDGSKITVKGTILGAPVVSRYGYKKTRLNFKMMVGQVALQVTFFNQPWLKNKLQPNQEMVINGRLNRKRMSLAGIKMVGSGQKQQSEAQYHVNKLIHQKTLRDLIEQAYTEYHDVLLNSDLVPISLRQKYRLENLATTIHNIHFPAKQTDHLLALRTAKFNEFFLYQARLQMIKNNHQRASQPLKWAPGRIKDFIQHLSFELTPAQQKVVNEILVNLKLPYQMNRLLQGDVGSGKTIVAAIAIYATITAGAQAALMVPTEILAEQHANKLVELFQDTEVKVALLTGDTKIAAKRAILARLKTGEINLVIGTHALIQDGVEYANLGLAVIDEQHRFGVHQRRLLREKGRQTNVLAMTATPIPRTLAITTFGEMDISVIDQLPNGRKPIITTWIKSGQLADIKAQIVKRLNLGQQMYVVAPLIEDSEKLEIQSAENTYQQFQKEFPNFKVGLLHGKMQDSEKNQIMNQFKQNQIQILISTTVIEVGVDVANATMMMILNADHFGLAQLHQLRGRVGRSSLQSYCILVADPKNELGKKRMAVMVESNDGFFISEKDLEIRGAGDMIGRQQSGTPIFKVGDPFSEPKDRIMLDYARRDAIMIISQPNWEEQDENLGLVKWLDWQWTPTVD